MISFTPTKELCHICIFKNLPTRSARRVMTNQKFFDKNIKATRQGSQRVMFLKAPKHFKSSKRHVIIWRGLYSKNYWVTTSTQFLAMALGESTGINNLFVNELNEESFIPHLHKAQVRVSAKIIFNGSRSFRHFNIKLFHFFINFLSINLCCKTHLLQ